ncbi:ion channel [Flavobacterium branchiophilum]|uniref:Inward rectifier potassium channel Irk n=1 Tax=Flavobacterium branchiophilum TaxID=55197 RepID=A0A2H3KDS9_9FLAO|nr:ion channel [Flavobacterium branchiophilum]PDS26233.1 Inward rectifier potassium channel Irk [Flavobacterium branchiophilum]
MSLIRKKNIRDIKSKANTGFGNQASEFENRFINKNGNANVIKSGISFLDSISWYHLMLTVSKRNFIFALLMGFILINTIFASLYYFIGIEHLNGINKTSSQLEQLAQAYFFSAQTFTTVGYGHISPKGFLTSMLAALEALIGLLSFALATGLFYGRFSKPKAFILFSQHAIIAPYKSGKALMVRLVPFKNISLIDAEVQITAGIIIEENNTRVNKFFTLDLEMNQIASLNLNWTLVHEITEQSPFYGFSQEDFAQTKGEIIVYFKAFDDMYSNTVSIKTSYIFEEIIYDAKFEKMYYNTPKGIILEIDKLNQITKL